MRYFLDTEFKDNGSTVELISIGIVAEDGRELYFADSAILNEDGTINLEPYEEWLRVNVLAQLPACECPNEHPKHPRNHAAFQHLELCVWRSRTRIRDAVEAFIRPSNNPARPVELWAFIGAYDMFCLVQLFGKMFNLPKHFPWIIRELKSYALDRGFSGSFKQLVVDTGHHSALMDARWNRDVHQRLQNLWPPGDALLAQIASARVAFSLDPGGPPGPVEGWYVVEDWIRAYFARGRL